MTAATTALRRASILEADLSDVRCYKCSKLLFRWERAGKAGISVKCPRCGQIDLIRLST